MKRLKHIERIDYKEKLEELGFSFHTIDNEKYWNEGTYYEFSLEEIDTIEDATNELHQMCLKGVEYVIKNNLFSKLKINEKLIPLIKKSWEQHKPTLIGRMDFTFKDGIPKLMEYNADTPASLIESSMVQWYWKEELFPNNEQFNMIYDNIILTLKKDFTNLKNMHLTGFLEITEDYENIAYMKYIMDEVGIETTLIDIKDIGTINNSLNINHYLENKTNNYFYDLDNNIIQNLYKLYPYEQLVEDNDFDNNFDINIIEPYWKSIISNKGFMCILWELFPNHKNLIPSYFENIFQNNEENYVKKPIYSREGANIEIYLNNTKKNDIIQKVISSEDYGYGEEGYIYQEYIELPSFVDNKSNETYYTMVGSWVIGGISSGIGIREDKSKITKNEAMFVPHIYKN
jgi:glutathionylspermidine synthase